MTSASPRRSRATSRSGSAPSPRRRSRWRARTPPSPTAASASTARSSATSRGRSRRSRHGRQRRRQPAGVSARSSAPTQADVINQLLQGVVQSGTGTAAALPGREVAGKTGTTENYGDAWFVGYTPQFVVAVWVGYPNKLVPDADRVPRPRGRRRHLPRADLEGVHAEGARAEAGPARELRGAAIPLRGAGEGRQPRRSARARQRRLPELLRRSSSSAARGRRAPPPASRTRSRFPMSSGRRSRRRRRGSTASRSLATVVYKPAQDRASGSGTSSASSRAGARHRRTTRSRSCWPSRCTASSRGSSGSSCRRRERKLARLHLKVRIEGHAHGRVVGQSLPPRTASAPGPDDRAHPEAGNGRLTKRDPASP